eukprot:Hpha_TRINITY_DN9237_c0_g1::TRINITY_DN9237_c0_g1_i1::g.28495::m.28495
MSPPTAFRAIEGSVPKFWNRANSGRPTPGPRYFGSPKDQGMSAGCDIRIGTILERGPAWVPKHSPTPSTGDRALAYVSAVQSAEQRRQEEVSGGVAVQKKMRERFVKAAKLWWSQGQLEKTYEDYKRHLVPVRQYYGYTKKTAGMANYSILRNVWETDSVGIMHYWNRRANPKVLGKDPVKVEAGEQKFGWKGSGDPFLVNGPLTQMHHSFRVHNQDYRTDGKLMMPTGIPWNLAHWANRATTKDKIWRNLERKMLQGKNNYFGQVGAFGKKKRLQQDWYQSLLATPVWRINFKPDSLPSQQSGWYLKMAAARGQNVRRSLASSRTPMSRIHDPSQMWQSGDQFSDGGLDKDLSPSMGRLERPDLPAL